MSWQVTAPGTTSESRANPSTRANQDSHPKAKSHPAQKMPPRDYLAKERAKQEELLNPSSLRAMRYNQAKKQQPRASQNGFWATLDKAANSNLITTINEAGDRVAHIVMDMVNPVTMVKETIADSKATIEAFQSGHPLRGIAYTGKTALDALNFVPVGKVLAGGVKLAAKGATAVASKIGLYGRGSVLEKAGSKSNPLNLMNEDIRSSQILEQLDLVPSTGVESSVALERKLSRLERVQSMADKKTKMSNGTIRYFDKFRAANKPGETIGSRFVTEYNPKTGDLIMWNETYNTAGVVDRVHLKNINGFTMDALHHPPTMKELNMISDRISGSSFRP